MQEREDVKLSRDALGNSVRILGHEIEWQLGPNATRKGYAYYFRGECAHCGARVTVGSSWSSCDGIRDARAVSCSGPGTKILTEIEAARASELFADAVTTYMRTLN